MADPVTLAIEIFVLVVVILILLSGIRILKEWERAPLLTLGRYRGLRGPGVIYVPPIISRVPFIISTRLQVASFKTEQTLTRDNVPVVVDAVMYFQPADLEKVVLGAEDFHQATELAAQTTLREVIGQATFDDVLTEREKVGSIARGIIDSKTELWGIKVTAVEIRDVGIPQVLQDAMSRQAQAERERRARVTLAEAEYEAAQKMVMAANLYSKSHEGLRLRWMNILYEIGQQAGSNTIMLVPSSMPEAGWPPMGMFGFKEIPKEAVKKETRTQSSE
jgi:regulator of protease activity HflC (stomatin/prohibitin superfamily)